MKNCSFCGREYADDMAVCPIDGQPVISPQAGPGKTVASPQTVRPAFDVRLVSPIFSAGKYRVFVERSDLLFIQMEGGSKSILAAAAPLLGPLGFVVPLVLWLLTLGKTHTKRQRLEAGDPEELLRESEANFRAESGRNSRCRHRSTRPFCHRRKSRTAESFRAARRKNQVRV